MHGRAGPGWIEALVGAEFAQHSFRVLQWLAAGVFLNSLAYVPFTLLQGVEDRT